jgi:hypothetical protein
MNTLAPVSVALKFGFLAVLYLFLLWVARSALRDLRGGVAGRSTSAFPAEPSGGAGSDGTGLFSAASPARSSYADRAPRLVVVRAVGHEPGMIYDLDDDLVLGRGASDIRLEDPFASSRHARIYAQAGSVVLEDLGSTNGTYLNEELLSTTPRPLHPGDHLRIGGSEFVFEVD